MPWIELTAQQKNLLKAKLGDDDLAKAIIDMVGASVSTNGINNTTPTYVAKTDYFETTNGITTWLLTLTNVQAFWEVTMGLTPKHINTLCDEAITHPIDLANFDSDDFDSVIRSVKGEVALPGLAQIRLKQTCDLFQYVLDTESTMKDQYLTAESLKSHSIQSKAIKEHKDSKDNPSGLQRLWKSTNILS